MNNFRNFMRNYMAGRYGIDQLSVSLIILGLILNLFASFLGSGLISILSAIPLIICYFRIFSRSITKRYQENQKFLNYYYPSKNWVQKRTERLKSSKTYKYYKCPNCKKTVRVPRGKGKIAITCPVCRNEFIKRT